MQRTLGLLSVTLAALASVGCAATMQVSRVDDTHPAPEDTIVYRLAVPKVRITTKMAGADVTDACDKDSQGARGRVETTAELVLVPSGAHTYAARLDAGLVTTDSFGMTLDEQGGLVSLSATSDNQAGKVVETLGSLVATVALAAVAASPGDTEGCKTGDVMASAPSDARKIVLKGLKALRAKTEARLAELHEKQATRNLTEAQIAANKPGADEIDKPLSELITRKKAIDGRVEDLQKKLTTQGPTPADAAMTKQLRKESDILGAEIKKLEEKRKKFPTKTPVHGSLSDGEAKEYAELLEALKKIDEAMTPPINRVFGVETIPLETVPEGTSIEAYLKTLAAKGKDAPKTIAVARRIK